MNVNAYLSRKQFDHLQLETHQSVYLKPRHTTVFD
jgi:hypothetical protein